MARQCGQLDGLQLPPLSLCVPLAYVPRCDTCLSRVPTPFDSCPLPPPLVLIHHKRRKRNTPRQPSWAGGRHWLPTEQGSKTKALPSHPTPTVGEPQKVSQPFFTAVSSSLKCDIGGPGLKSPDNIQLRCKAGGNATGWALNSHIRFHQKHPAHQLTVNKPEGNGLAGNELQTDKHLVANTTFIISC